MPKRRKSTKRRRTLATTRKRRTYRRKRDLSLNIDAGIAKEIWAVMYAAIGILTIMSLRGDLGIVGDYWTSALEPIFGFGIYIVPVFLLGIAASLIFNKNVYFGLARILGLVLMITACLGIVHLSVPEEDIYTLASEGKYGGLIGFVASFSFRLIFGVTGAYVVLMALLLISFLLTFETSLVYFFGFFRWLFPLKINVNGKQVKIERKKTPSVEMEVDLTQNRELNIVKPNVGKDKDDGNDDEVLLRESEVTFVNSDTVNNSTNKTASDDQTFQNDFQISELEYEWEYPDIDLLSDATMNIELNDKFLKKNAELIKGKLSQFGIDVAMHDVHVGPTVIQYTLRPHAGVKLSKITSLKSDLGLALAAKAVRIEAPIPGKSLVGIEIPNNTRSTVHLREILTSKEFNEFKGRIKLPLGRDVSGDPVIAALEQMPHLLIAGATGAGKSVAINSILLSLFYQFSPRELKLILMDPKRVELNNYNSIPHLLTPVVTDVEKAVIALRWAVKEMTRRYQICAESGHRSIIEYNSDSRIREKLPYIVVVVDEMADLMMTTGKEVEASICRIAQMARAVGIHLIIATQRPSVDVITGLIKANIPARVAFTMSSSIDSRTVLDMVGAEDLLGHGDMLFLSGTMSKTTRVQGVFVSSNEIEKVTNKLKVKSGLQYDDSIISDEVAEEKVQGLPDSVLVQSNSKNSSDALYNDALRLIMEHRKASASLLQRRLSIGYARAARLLDLLEGNGVIGPSNGAKPRSILISGSE